MPEADQEVIRQACYWAWERGMLAAMENYDETGWIIPIKNPYANN